MERAMHLSIGYQITNSHVEEKRALAHAFELVRRAREMGAHTREWANRAMWESRTLMGRLRKDTGTTVAAKLWEIACLESKIITGLRSYMNETSELMNGLKPLNPPLRSDQLKPFMEAMVSDRNVTVQSMDMLTKIIGELTAYRAANQSIEPNPAFGYTPNI